jgi:hypothetical protein
MQGGYPPRVKSRAPGDDPPRPIKRLAVTGPSRPHAFVKLYAPIVLKEEL